MDNKKFDSALSRLEMWRKNSLPWPMFIDSGVYSLQAKLGTGLTATGARAFAELSASERKIIRDRLSHIEGTIAELVEWYAKFLKAADGLWDYAIEMDVDNFLGVEYSDKYYAY